MVDAYTDETTEVYRRNDMMLWCFSHGQPDDDCEGLPPESGCVSTLILKQDAEPMTLKKIVDCPSWCNYGYRDITEHNHENWVEEHKWTSGWIEGT